MAPICKVYYPPTIDVDCSGTRVASTNFGTLSDRRASISVKKYVTTMDVQLTMFFAIAPKSRITRFTVTLRNKLNTHIVHVR